MWRLPRDKEKGFTTRNIRKEGPTNCIVTTTALNLHGENETRMLSLSTNDSASQTQAIMRQLAAGSAQDSTDLTERHNLQIWLAGAERRVVIPYAGFLANNIPPIAVRLRRDFRAILRLIETHAMLHQLTRGRDESGRVVAEVADYAAIRDLVADLVSEGVGSMVPDSVRETVKIVEEIAGSDGARIDAVAARLKIERSAAGRRLGTARERGYIDNLEEKRGRPARYVLGAPLPEKLDLLPPVAAVRAHLTPGTPPSAQPNLLDCNDETEGCAGVQVCPEGLNEMWEKVI